ncbi:hypothetical protein MKZ38_001521 [Zalerion maritima]|uniref:Uncharacterized protein n=1 Tax=Zalerion maritima TaxID=339359 RepID=A0AAD5RRD9_9PEZI|nr:hypothetical protein MKZ38_001521 [Zalerion maritima]
MGDYLMFVDQPSPHHPQFGTLFTPTPGPPQPSLTKHYASPSIDPALQQSGLSSIVEHFTEQQFLSQIQSYHAEKPRLGVPQDRRLLMRLALPFPTICGLVEQFADGFHFLQGNAAIHELELKHHDNVHQIDLTGKDEDVRRMKMRYIVLRDENASLKTKVSQTESTNEELDAQCAQFQHQIQELQRQAKEQEAQRKSKDKEISNLRAELDGINEALRDSNSTTQKYHTTSAELSRLKPEVEHLRTQMADYQELIATKLSLERSLNQAEVELESEKRASQRARGKANHKAEEELRDRISELENQLSTEKRQMERLRSDSEDASSRNESLQADLDKATTQTKELEAELKDAKNTIKSHRKAVSADNSADLQVELEQANEALAEVKGQLKQTKTELKRSNASEHDIESLRAQLKEAKSDLKSVRAELRAQNNVLAVHNEPALSRKGPNKAAAAKPKKRVNEIVAEQTTFLDSPEITKRPAKKRVLDLVAEKSNFSITPFLNRTKELEEVIDEDGELEDSILQASKNSLSNKVVPQPTEPEPEPEPEAENKSAGEPENPVEEVVQEAAPKRKQKRVTKASAATVQEPKKRGRPSKAALSESASAKKNATISAKTEGKSAKASAVSFGLEKVVEEDEEAEASGSQSDKAPEMLAVSIPKGILKKSAAASSAAPPNETLSSAENLSLDSLDKELDGKRKKRKLVGGLGKTLFEDEDGEGEPAPIAAAAAAESKKAAGGKVRLAGKGAAAKARLGKIGGLDAFGKTFSPLKKDRRGGVQHSFLA